MNYSGRRIQSLSTYFLFVGECECSPQIRNLLLSVVLYVHIYIYTHTFFPTVFFFLLTILSLLVCLQAAESPQKATGDPTAARPNLRHRACRGWRDRRPCPRSIRRATVTGAPPSPTVCGRTGPPPQVCTRSPTCSAALKTEGGSVVPHWHPERLSDYVSEV